MGAFEMQKYLNGASKEGLGIGSAVFQQVAEEFVTRRKQFKKARLRRAHHKIAMTALRINKPGKAIRKSAVLGHEA